MMKTLAISQENSYTMFRCVWLFFNPTPVKRPNGQKNDILKQPLTAKGRYDGRSRMSDISKLFAPPIEAEDCAALVGYYSSVFSSRRIPEKFRTALDRGNHQIPELAYSTGFPPTNKETVFPTPEKPTLGLRCVFCGLLATASAYYVLDYGDLRE